MFGKKKEVKKEPVSSPSTGRVQRMVPELATLSYTVTGNRQYQQDAVYVSKGKKLAANKKTRVLAVVCDGMGGMADGGKASQTAIQMLVSAFKQIEKSASVDIPTFFRQGILAIDEAIYNFPKENGKGSGTTMVAVIAEDNKREISLWVYFAKNFPMFYLVIYRR